MNNYIVSFPGLGIENIELTPIAFNLFGFPIYWYGLLIASAVLLCSFLAVKQSKKFDLNEDTILDMLLLAIPLALVSARIYYVIFEWDSYKDNLWKVFDTRSGGMAFYGGVIGGVLAVLLMAVIKKIAFSKIVDYLIVYIPLGQAIGRWGNFFNQEAFGTNTSLPWGMISNGTRSYLAVLSAPNINPDLPVHPTFLYESIANILIFALLLYIRKNARHRFETFSWYLALYGMVRFFVESIRTDALFIADSSIRVSMLLSALMVVVSMSYLGFHWFRDFKLGKLMSANPDLVAELESESNEVDKEGMKAEQTNDLLYDEGLGSSKFFKDISKDITTDRHKEISNIASDDEE